MATAVEKGFQMLLIFREFVVSFDIHGHPLGRRTAGEGVLCSVIARNHNHIFFFFFSSFFHFVSFWDVVIVLVIVIVATVAMVVAVGVLVVVVVPTVPSLFFLRTAVGTPPPGIFSLVFVSMTWWIIIFLSNRPPSLSCDRAGRGNATTTTTVDSVPCRISSGSAVGRLLLLLLLL